ncbi:BRO family protein, partial [Hominisplanchenecus faecis]
MGQLKIFENEEFGQIRTVMRDGEVWFVGKDVANGLGYSNARKALGDHVDKEDKGVTKRDTLGGVQELTIVNESGLYSLVLSSKLPSAKRFKRWVTSEVLPAIRKTGSYDMDEYSPEMKAILMHDKKLVKIDNRVTDLENHMTIDYGQQTVLGDEVNKAVLDALGGKYSNAYNEIGKKVFAECNRDLKHYFHVNARNNVPKKRYYEALEYIQEWKP